MAENILITTGSCFEGYNIDEYLGFIASHDLIGSNFFKNITASVADISDKNDANLENCKEDAEAHLIAEAKKKKANAILGMKMEYVTFSSTSIGVVATGTAVRISPKAIVDTGFHKELVVKNYYTRVIPKPVLVVLDGNRDDINMSVQFFNYNQDEIVAIRADVEFTNVFDEKLIIKGLDFSFKKTSISLIQSEFIPSDLTFSDVNVLKDARVIINKYATPRGVFNVDDNPVDITMSTHRLEVLKASRGIDAVERYRTDGMIWTCNCGHVNEAGSEECIVCGRKQEEIKGATGFNYEEMIDKMKEKEYVIEIKDVLMDYIQQQKIETKYRMPLLEIMESGINYEKTRGNMKDSVIEKVEKVFEDGIK